MIITDLIKRKNAWSLTLVAAAVIALVTLIYGSVTKALVYDSFNPVIIAFLIAGAVAAIAAFVLPFDFMNFLPVPFVGVAFAVLAYDSAPVIADKINGINLVQGNFSASVVLLVLMSICGALLCLACFLGRSNKQS